MVTKLLIIPSAILGVLFPAFAANYRHDHATMVRLFVRGSKYIAVILFPVLLLVVSFSSEGLRWWLGEEFARQSAPVLQCLAIGVFINSLAQVFFSLIQGIGRPDLTAKLHLLELPVYVPLLWWAVHRYGILGAAIVWTVRVAVDAALLFWLACGFLGNNGKVIRQMTAGLLAAVGALVLPIAFEGAVARIAVALILVCAFTVTVWLVVLEGDERASFGGRLPWRTAA
jgi:O-antigen/teichoic acid export membrane protein